MADILHALQVDLSRLVAQTPFASCLLPCLSGTPPSPVLEPQQDELETLLEPQEGWDDRLDGQLAHRQRGFKAAASGSAQFMSQSKQPLSLRLNGLFGARGRPQSTTRFEGQAEALDLATSSTPGLAASNTSDAIDQDAQSLQPSTLDRLAERFESGISLEQMEREEAEQAERERIPGQRDERYDFGEFSSA